MSRKNLEEKSTLINLTLSNLRDLWTFSNEEEQVEIQQFANKLKKFSKDRYIAKDIQEMQAKLLEWSGKKPSDYQRLFNDVQDVFKTDV